MDFPISFSDLKDVATMLEQNITLTDLSLRLDPTAIIQNNDYENNNNDNKNTKLSLNHYKFEITNATKFKYGYILDV